MRRDVVMTLASVAVVVAIAAHGWRAARAIDREHAAIVATCDARRASRTTRETLNTLDRETTP